jgi:hypothetical protein
MAVNKSPWLYNRISGAATPVLLPGLFLAGSSQAIKRGEILERTNSTNTVFVPWDADEDITTGIAVANEEIKSGDLAGYYPVIAIMPGDVFEFTVASAAATALGAALTYSSSQVFTTGGAQTMAYSVGHDHYPQMQGHASDDATGDRGTSIRSVSRVEVCFKKSRTWAYVCGYDK